MRTLHSTLLLASVFLVVLGPVVRADSVLWQATGSGAWISGGNWEGGVMPWEGDTAQFGTGPATITLSLHHASYGPPKGEGRIGAIQLLEARTTDLLVTSNANSSSKLYFYGQNIHGVANTILVNDSQKDLTLNHYTGTNVRSMDIVLRENENHVIQVNHTGNITIHNRIDGENAHLTIQSGLTGTGIVTLQGVALTNPTTSSYSGGTTLVNGTLVLAADHAAGTGKIVNQGGALKVSQGLVVNNEIELASYFASYQRDYQTGNGYSNYAASSNLGSGDIQYRVLAGEASDSRSLVSEIEDSTTATNEDLRQSVVLGFEGTGNDIYVLQLGLSDGALTAGSYLGWLSEGEWQQAIEGNSSLGELAMLGVSGSYESAGIGATSDYLGSWGYDLVENSVWAVLDHGGTFAVVIPEPHVLAYTGLIFLTVMIVRKRKVHESC